MGSIIKNTVTVLGVQFPVSDEILYPKKTEVVAAYINAIKAGKGEAKKHLKVLS